MASRRLVLSTNKLVAQLSRLSLVKQSSKVYANGVVQSSTLRPSYVASRYFSNGGDKDKSEEKNTPNADAGEDPFGVNFDDGSDRLGPTLPPKYKRDTTTGRFTGEIEKELTEEQKRLLAADPVTKDKTLLNRIARHWQDDEDGDNVDEKLIDLGRRIRDSDMSLNVLGRSVEAQAAKEKLDDGSELGRDLSGFSQHLTPEEFKSFSKFMEEQYSVDVSEDDIPVHANSGSKDKKKKRKDGEDDDIDPDDVELSLKWLTARAQRQMDDVLDDNPYSDLMPGDLNPTRLVNRKRAKQIPRKLLHHNNVALLHRYVTPTGQIQNRVQTRLGARDQRRVAKLIRRARALGLLPYMGQSKVEQHGWKHAADINEQRDWERELIDRGLAIRRDPKSE